MTKKGNEGFVPILLLIAGLAIVIVLSLFWVRGLPLTCLQNGTCIILPFINRGGFLATSTAISASKIPQPVISSIPAVNVIDCQYYNINSIRFEWEIPVGVDGVEYGVSENPDYEFSKTSQGVVSRAEYDLKLFDDGILYFSARFSAKGGSAFGGKEGNYWGPAAVKYFYLDRTPPKPFRIVREDGDFTNEQPAFNWNANDKTSGIAYYQIKIGEGNWFNANTIRDGESYVFPEQSPAYSRSLIVRAYDFVGNFQDSFTNFQVIPKTGWRSFLYKWPLFLIVAVIIAAAFLPFLLIYRLIKWRGRFGRKIRRDFKVIEKIAEDIKDDGQNH
ncbi:MAG: hypothetical protein Q7K44_02250 [Candidatus Liptonbacteria bacterium]|nr:hypothetical protein [Candidatus Liptonbacteria bacterium]